MASTTLGSVDEQEGPPRDLMPDALVLRSGKHADLDVLIAQASNPRVIERIGQPALSCMARPQHHDEVDQDVIEDLLARLRGDWYGVTTAREIYDCGFGLKQTLTWPHHSILIDTLDDRERLQRLAEAFQPPRRRQ